MAADAADFEPAYETRETELLFQLRYSVGAIFGVAENSHDRIDRRVVDRAQAVADFPEFRLMAGGQALRLDDFADRVEVVAQAGLYRCPHLRAIASDKHHQRRSEPIVRTLVPHGFERVLIDFQA